MIFFLPLLFLFFCSVILHRNLESWRACALFAAIITATALTVMTEGLSLFQSFSFYPVLISWFLLTFAAGLKVFSAGQKVFCCPPVDLKTWALIDKFLLGIIVFVLAVSAFTAFFGVPNTWDSMTYHLPRVEHWMQDRTVSFYPTSIIRQLYYAPWSEFAIAHARILGAGETSANFIQWMAMAGSLIGVSLIAGQWGAGRTGQLTAAVIAACLPMGILQSVSTQTDYVGAFWMIVYVYFLIEAQRQFTWPSIMAAGLSLGLALLTKGNSYIFALPFLGWFLVMNLKHQLTRGLSVLLLMIVCTMGLNTGQYLRTVHLSGAPLNTVADLMNGAFNLKVLWVNVLRNAGLHLATPLAGVNEETTQFITKAAGWLGADINDPQASLGGHFFIGSIGPDEDYSGNFMHTLLFVIVGILFLFDRRPKAGVGWYMAGVILSFLLFCLIMRYQPWNSRFHLPLFILFCPVAGFILERFLNRKSIFIAALLLLGALPYLFFNHQHPWFGRQSIWQQPKEAQYFYKHPYLALPVVETTAFLKSINCHQVGLLMGADSWEYPWWVFLGSKGTRIEEVEVGNFSASLKYPLGDFQACAIIVSGVQAPPYIIEGDAVYGPAGAVPAGDDKITIFLKKNV